MDRILVTDRFTTESLQRLRSQWNCEVHTCSSYPKAEDLKDVQALLIRSRTRIDKDFLKLAPRLRVIVTATSGFDHIDLELSKEKNIQVMNTPDANTEGAAELTMMLLLSALRRVGHAQKSLRAHGWKDQCPTGIELKGKSVGIIGLGRVGSRVAEFLQAFGAEVLAHDPYQTDAQFDRLRLKRWGLTEVLVQAQILTAHVPLTKETRHMINAQTLAQAQDGLILINTSRGAVVDETALMAALDNGSVAAAGLDVFENEPLAKESRLRKYPQVFLTPHIGAYTDEAFTNASEMAVDRLLLFLKDGLTQDLLTP